MNEFKYYKTSTLLNYVGKTVEWLSLSGKVLSGKLLVHAKRTYLPESGGVWADTVKIKLPKK